MKNPESLAQQLTKQWHNNRLRAERLLGQGFPIELNIGKPSNADMIQRLNQVHQHFESWRKVQIGTVVFEDCNYQSLAGPVSVPLRWQLHKPSEWVAACADKTVQNEYQQLAGLIRHVKPLYHELLIRERSLWKDRPTADIIQTTELAEQLSPGCAQGKPLRLLSNLAIDTKFIERNQYLLQRCLDLRFNGAASSQGLLPFLDAAANNEHWLLIKPLGSSLLPFPRLRLSTSELQQNSLPAQRILIIENEQCEHLLPKLHDCIAILGAGRDLSWLSGAALDNKTLYYWGDMDTWGLTMLAQARKYRPAVQAIMMNQECFQAFSHNNAVNEPSTASQLPEQGLTPEEQVFYRFLLSQEKGRLEQEFLPADFVHHQLTSLIV